MGAAVLASGGNAADAAIAASAVQCVRELPWCGLGGDGFALVSSADGTLAALNGAGAVPRALATAQVPGGIVPRFGPLSISVPGLVDAWWRLWQRHGTRPFDSLMEPAAAHAEEGFVLDDAFAAALHRVRETLDASDPFMTEFCDGNGSVAGARFRLPGLARTLRELGADGPSVFYRGRLASALVETVQRLGGLLSAGDLDEHTCDFEPPITVRYGSAEVSVTPPPSMGWVLLQMLQLYRHLDGGLIDDEADRIDLMVRCKHAAFTDLAGMSRWQEAADVAPPLSDESLARWCALIAEQRRSGSPPSVAPHRRAAPASTSSSVTGRRESGSPPPVGSGNVVTGLKASDSPPPVGSGDAVTRRGESGSPPPVRASGSAAVEAAIAGADTTCLSVVDGQGLMVTFIHSLFNEFGSRVVVPGTGIVLNDRLANQSTDLGRDDGSSRPRRPLHTLVGYHVALGDRRLVGATPGGRGQVQTNFQVLRTIIDEGVSPQSAVDRPRWLSGAPRLPNAHDLLFLEPGFAPAAGAELARRGHKIAPNDAPVESDLFGSCTITGIDTASGETIGAADHRRTATLTP